MKHLRRYNESSEDNIKQRIEDILLDIKDDEFNYVINSIPNCVELQIWKGSELREIGDLPSVRFSYKEIMTSMDHVRSYLQSNNYKMSEIESLFPNSMRMIKSDYYMRKIVGRNYEHLDRLPDVVYLKITFKLGN